MVNLAQEKNGEGSMELSSKEGLPSLKTTITFWLLLRLEHKALTLIRDMQIWIKIFGMFE